MEYPEMSQIPHMRDCERLPEHFRTHRHDPLFWKHLGRTIATYRFLEEILGKAIFALKGTRLAYEEGEFEKWYPEFISTLEKVLTDPLGNLINSFEKALNHRPWTTSENHEKLLPWLREATKIRNVLCHGSWRLPDEDGRALPLFINNKLEIFETPVDVAFLQQTQRNTAELSCEVMNTVTRIGYQFPGSGGGPGLPVW